MLLGALMKRTINQRIINENGTEFVERFTLELLPPTDYAKERTRIEPEEDGSVWVLRDFSCARQIDVGTDAMRGRAEQRQKLADQAQDVIKALYEDPTDTKLNRQLDDLTDKIAQVDEEAETEPTEPLDADHPVWELWKAPLIEGWKQA